MKKSQLRNIIKESIKGLMNEQYTTPSWVTSGSIFDCSNKTEVPGGVQGSMNACYWIFDNNPTNELTDFYHEGWASATYMMQNNAYENQCIGPNGNLLETPDHMALNQCPNDLAFEQAHMPITFSSKQEFVTKLNLAGLTQASTSMLFSALYNLVVSPSSVHQGCGGMCTPTQGWYCYIPFCPPGAPNDVYGCTDPTASNYNAAATQDDGSCTYLNPCDDFNAAPISLQQGCCGKCVNGVYTGSPTDPCGMLGNFCDCCPEPVGDERGCLDSTATNYLECCPQNNYPGCVANIPTNEDCCKYEPNDYGWVCDVDPFVPLKEQWGPIPINSFACQPGTASNPGSYPTQILCQAANTNIPKGCGMSSQIQCSKCNNGYPISNMFSGPNCPPGWQLASLGNPCKPLPNPNDPLDMVDPQIQRMKTLMGYKKPK